MLKTTQDRADRIFAWAQKQFVWGYCNMTFRTLDKKGSTYRGERARSMFWNNAKDITSAYERAHTREDEIPFSVRAAIQDKLAEYYTKHRKLAPAERPWVEKDCPCPQRQYDEYFCALCGRRWGKNENKPECL